MSGFRWTRKTVVALAVSGALVAAGAVVAVAAVFELPVFGLGAGGGAHTAAPTVVDKTIYHDHLVPKPGPTGDGGSRQATQVTAGGGAGGGGAGGSSTTAPPVATGPSGPATTAPAGPAATVPTTAPTTAPPATEPEAPPTTQPGTPPPPAGCREPEWDPEHHVWQCSGTGTDT